MTDCRHVPDSLATLRHEIAVGLAATLQRCPCCTRPVAESRQWAELPDAVGL